MKKVNAQMVVTVEGDDFMKLDMYSILANGMAYGGIPPFKLNNAKVFIEVDGKRSPVTIPEWAETHEPPIAQNPFNALN